MLFRSPLPKVPAAGEPLGFVPPHSRRRRQGLLAGYSLASRQVGRAAEAGSRVCQDTLLVMDIPEACGPERTLLVACVISKACHFAPTLLVIISEKKKI